MMMFPSRALSSFFLSYLVDSMSCNCLLLKCENMCLSAPVCLGALSALVCLGALSALVCLGAISTLGL